jgi:hypothetical protein
MLRPDAVSPNSSWKGEQALEHMKISSDKLLFLNECSLVYEEALSVLNAVLPDTRLNAVQTLVFCQSWQGKPYLEIAATSDYDADYVKDVGYRLWNMFSEALGERVTKNSFRVVFNRHYQKIQPPQPPALLDAVAQSSLDWITDAVDLSFSVKPIYDWGQAPDVKAFEGRTSEIAQLEQWILQDQCRLVGLLGLAGVGKTTLAIKLTERLQSSFDCLVWRSLRNAPNFEEFSTDLLQTLAGKSLLALPTSPDGRISLLIEHLRQHRCLLVLDGWASVLHHSDSHLAGSYKAGYEHYGQLLRCMGEGRHQSTLLMTSREKPIGLVLMEGESLSVRTLQLNGLLQPAALSVLRSLGLSGANDDLEILIHRYAGNPLALKAASRTIIDLFDGNIAKFLKHSPIVYGDIRHILGQHLSRLSTAEHHVMVYLAEKHTWASFEEMVSGLGATLPQETLLEALESLNRRGLLQKRGTSFLQFDMIREYVLNQS